MKSDSDLSWMKKALAVARRGQGTTAENPSVGCLIVDKSGNLAGVGWTSKGGRPHAEINALTMAGETAKGATAYVTLEPCAHHGKSPPCAEALVKTGITRAVIATKDPDRRVSGKGIEILTTAGVEVVLGICQDEANELHAGFFSRIINAKPYVTLKMAMSRDGKIARKKGEQTAITGPEFKAYTHLMRARADAILIGAETARIDKPSLTCRLPGLQDRSPQIVVVGGDKDLSLPQDAWHFPRPKTGLVDLDEVLKTLARRGINNLLVEGGAKMAASFLKQNLVDEAVIATSPTTIGAQGVDAFYSLPVSFVTNSDDFVLTCSQSMGKDKISHYKWAKKDK